MKKKLMLLMIIAAVLVCMQAQLLTGYAEEIAAGECGTGITWLIDQAGVLKITGTGEMDSNAKGTNAPWYANNSKIVTVQIGAGITGVPSGAFTGCSNLKSIEAEADNKTFISDDGVLFSADKTTLICYPGGKTESRYDIPENVQTIGDDAFSDCGYLRYISLPDSITAIGNDAFANCRELLRINIPDSVSNIGNGILYGCPELTMADAEVIGTEMFRECYAMEYAVIPKGTATIGRQTYQRAMALKSIAIPADVKSIEKNAFDQCTNLSDIYYEGSDAQWRQISLASGNDRLSTAAVHCNSKHPVCIYDFIYSDLNGSKWYFDAVKFAIDNNIMSGSGDGLFSPYGELTRASLLQILYNYEGQPQVAFVREFNDVNENAWYANAVSWAVSQNIVNGVSEGTFAPNNALTREQLAVILKRWADVKGEDTSAVGNLGAFADGKSVSKWANTAVSWAVGRGLFSGNEEGKINARGKATRAQVAGVMKTYLKAGSAANPTTEKIYRQTPAAAFAFSHNKMQLLEGQSAASGLSAGENTASVRYTSSDSNVAKVDEEGIITGVSAGNTVITAVSGGNTTKCQVSVITPVLKSISIPEALTLKTGASAQIEATIRPSYVSPAITWTSSDNTVAGVNGSGLVTAYKTGTAVIKAFSEEVSSECIVTVGFSDVDSGSPFAEDINWAYENGIMNGISDTEFGPSGKVNKAQMAVYIWKLNGSPSMAGTKNPFTDVKPADSYYDAVIYVYTNGIATPQSASVFGVCDECTRKTAVTMMWNCQKQRVKYSGGFKDVTSASDFYYPARWAAATGISNGVFGSTVSPDKKITRSEVARMLHLASEKNAIKFDKSKWQIIYPKAEKVLETVGYDLKAAFNWSASMPYYGHNSSMPDTAAPGTKWYANYGFDNHKGNCYVMAATFFEMASNLGYNPRQMSGKVPMRSGGLGPHSWVEMEVDGVNYVFDPDFQYGTKKNGFKINYGQPGTWRYQSYAPMGL